MLCFQQLSSLVVSTLQSSLSPSPAEVSACLWADSRLVGAIVSAVDGYDAEVQLEDLPNSIRYRSCDRLAVCKRQTADFIS